MKNRILFIILTLYLLLSAAPCAFATAGGEAAVPDPTVMYAGIIALLCATVGVIFYVIYTYFKK